MLMIDDNEIDHFIMRRMLERYNLFTDRRKFRRQGSVKEYQGKPYKRTAIARCDFIGR